MMNKQFFIRLNFRYNAFFSKAHIRFIVFFCQSLVQVLEFIYFFFHQMTIQILMAQWCYEINLLIDRIILNKANWLINSMFDERREERKNFDERKIRITSNVNNNRCVNSIRYDHSFVCLNRVSYVTWMLLIIVKINQFSKQGSAKKKIYEIYRWINYS